MRGMPVGTAPSVSIRLRNERPTDTPDREAEHLDLNEAEEVTKKGVHILSVGPMIGLRYHRPIGGGLDVKKWVVRGEMGARESANGAH